MLVAGLCLALGGEPNLRKKKGWLFFAARRVSWAIACDPTLACATGRRAHSARAEAGGEGRGRRPKAFPSDNTDHATLLLEAKANRDRLFPGGAMPEPTKTEAEAQADAEAEAEEGGVHEAAMDEPEGAEPTAEEYNAFFDAIMAMP